MDRLSVAKLIIKPIPFLVGLALGAMINWSWNWAIFLSVLATFLVSLSIVSVTYTIEDMRRGEMGALIQFRETLQKLEEMRDRIGLDEEELT
jgi:hypothetical protein